MRTEAQFFSLSAITLACALAITSLPAAHAAETQLPDDENMHKLQTVEVVDVLEENGRIVLDRSELDMAPTSTSTVSDALRGNSFVQFDRNSRNGLLGGEITPPQLSIRGSRNYENNFMINGLSNNNAINPSGFVSSDQFGVVPPKGDAQAIFLNTDLLDSVTVLSENISAQYGEFTGGVVDAQVRDARNDRWHAKAWVRHTRDSWANQHFVPGSKEMNEEFPNSLENVQKEFRRTETGVTLDGPLMDGKLGALISYQKTHSSVPVWTEYGSKRDRNISKRDNDNFMVRLNTDPRNDFYVSGTLIYAPYELEQYATVNRNGEFGVDGGGWNFTLNTRNNLSFGKWTNDFGYSNTDVSRTAQSNRMYQWLTKPNGKPSQHCDWSTAKFANEGLMGDYEQTQEAFNAKSMIAFKTIGETVKHDINAGISLEYKTVEATAQGWENWLSGVASDKVKGDLSNGVIAGEQYASKHNISPGYSRDMDYFAAAAFVEDKIKVERFTIRPGVRASYDDVTEDVNIAPRFTMVADVLNDGRFDIDMGYNRYYGSQILGHAVTFMARTQSYSRTENPDGTLTDWVPSKFNKDGFIQYKDLGNLDTPYSDEFVIGATARVWDSVFKIQGVKREYKDQLRTVATSSRPGYTHEMTNSGRSEYKGITFTFEKAFDLGKWGRHMTEFGITRSDLEGNSMNWLGSWDEEAGAQGYGNNFVRDFVILDGNRVPYTDLPANNYNSDWVVTYTHNASFMDDRLRSTLWLRWESEADRIVKDGYQIIDGKKYAVLHTAENEDMFNADLSLAYDLVKRADSTLTLNMDVLNVFDNKNLVNASTNETGGNYSMGRQFYLGLSYEY